MEDEEYFDTKLHEAVRYCDLDDVREALKEGFNPNQIGIYQWNPLHEATSNGDLQIVKFLLKYGGDPNKQDQLKDNTAVHYAALHGFHEILELLLNNGGVYNIFNREGHTALDLAQNGECSKLLRKLRNEDITNTTSKDIILQNVIHDTSLNNINKNNANHRQLSETDSVYSVDPDEISMGTDSSSSSRPHSRCWGADRLLGIKKDITLGQIQLSFEYNSKKGTFKVRVWQLTNLLMPPPETSQIRGIYVKSFLQPDERKSTKRKTEEIRVTAPPSTSSDKNNDNTSNIVNFMPATFKFSEPLQYEQVTSNTIIEKIVDIEVCITQKFSRKSYVIAFLTIPMQHACKLLIKQKFPLQPRIGSQLPENMKVYGASESDIQSMKYSTSNPSLYRQGSMSSWAVPYAGKAISESNLDFIVVEKNRDMKVPSIEVSVPDEEDIALQEALQQISIMENDYNRSHSIEMKDITRLPGTIGSDPVHISEVEVHVPNSGSENRRNTMLSPGDVVSLSTSTDNFNSDAISVTSSMQETLSWDYYNEVPMFSEHALDIEDELPLPDLDIGGLDPLAPILPVATSLEIPEIHESTQHPGNSAEVESRIKRKYSRASAKSRHEENVQSSPEVCIEMASFPGKKHSEIAESCSIDEESAFGMREDTRTIKTRKKRVLKNVIDTEDELLDRRRDEESVIGAENEVFSRSEVVLKRSSSSKDKQATPTEDLQLPTLNRKKKKVPTATLR